MTKLLNMTDLNVADWLAAEERRAVSEDASPRAAEAPGGGEPSLAVAAQALQAKGRPQAWLGFTRFWAVAKMAALAYSTWWAMGYLHARLGAELSAYGAVCVFAGVGARWRKRFFGPGQLLEPQLYEAIGTWLYRAGAALILCGGVAMAAEALLSH
jgi:hypothetical protein